MQFKADVLQTVSSLGGTKKHWFWSHEDLGSKFAPSMSSSVT